MPDGPLNGITVIDLTRVLAGPYCTMMLHDLGARVIKVEQPDTGDDAREIGPFMGPLSGYFASINRGKESIALNLRNDCDREVFEALLGSADVLIENFRPGVMDRLGYAWAVLKERHPGLIYAAVSGFGQNGPYSNRPAYDLIVQAMGGVMSLTGHPGGEPTRVGTSIGDIAAALFTTIGITSALHHRTRTGEGIMIDVAMLDCQIAILENAIVRHATTGETPGPLGTRHPSIVPFDAFRTSDGYIVIAAGNDDLFLKLCDVLRLPCLASDSRFSTNAMRARHVDALQKKLEKVLTTEPGDHWLAVLQEAGVPCGSINTVADVMTDPHVASRNMIVTAEDARAGPIRMSGNPIKLSAFEDPARRGRVPGLDEHREAILRELRSREDA